MINKKKLFQNKNLKFDFQNNNLALHNKSSKFEYQIIACHNKSSKFGFQKSSKEFT